MSAVVRFIAIILLIVCFQKVHTKSIIELLSVS
jgi:hypothetical protein